MTRGEAFCGWMMLAAIVAGSLLVGSCTDRLLRPGRGVPVQVALAVAPAPGGSGGDASACARANQARVRLSQNGALLLDSTLAVAGACDQPISLQVQLNGTTGTLQLSVALLANGQTLFQGATAIQLRSGMRVDVQLPVVAVPGGLVAPDSLRTFTKLGDSVQLGGAVVFATGDTVQGLRPTWADDGRGLVSVGNGFARARAEGSAVLTASFQDFSRVTRVGVKAVVASVAIMEVGDSASMVVGRTRALTAVARDSNRNLLARVVSWTSSDPKVATTDTGGVVRAVGLGRALVIAVAEAKSDTLALTVGQAPVARLSVMPSAFTLDVGGTEQLTATTYDAAGNVLTGRAVEWRSENDRVATVSATGVVTAVAGGWATIGATSEGVTGSARIRVPDQPILAVTPAVANDTILMFRQDTVGVVLQVTNAGGGTLDGLSVAVSYPGVEAPEFIRRATLDRTVAPARLTIVYRDTLWYGSTTTLHAILTVSASATGTTPVSVPLTLTVLGPVLQVSPTAVYDTVYPLVEGPLDTALLQVTNAGGGSISGLSAQVAYPGLEGYDACMDSVGFSSTFAPANLTLFYNDTLTNGTTCHATVTVFSASGGTTPVDVPITVEVRGPVLRLSTAAVDDTITAGTPDTVRVQVTNTGIGTLDGLSVTVNYLGGPNWIAGYSLDSTTAPATLTVTTGSALPAGSYSAYVSVWSSARGTVPRSVAYQLTVQ